MAKIAKTTKNIIKCSVCVHQANEHKYKILAIDIERAFKAKILIVIQGESNNQYPLQKN